MYLFYNLGGFIVVPSEHNMKQVEERLSYLLSSVVVIVVISHFTLYFIYFTLLVK